AGAAAGRRVVDIAVLGGGEVADVDRVERPFALGHRLAGARLAERAGKHVGIEGQDGSAPGICTHQRVCRGLVLRRGGRSAHASSSLSPGSGRASVSGGGTTTARPPLMSTVGTMARVNGR